MQGSVSQRVKAGPAFYGCLSLAFGIFFLFALLAQIATTQAALAGSGQVNMFKPNWQILVQIPRLIGFVGPDFTAREGSSVLISWFISLAYVGMVVGNEIFDDIRRGKGVLITALFRIGMFLIAAYNFWSDFQYGLMVFEGFAGAFLFAVIVSFIVAFSGLLCAEFAEKAYKAI